MEELLWIVLVAVAAVAVLAFVRGLFRRVTVYEWERGLRYHKGRLRDTLGPGQYWIYERTTDVFKLDTRPRFVSIPGQEVLSADGVTLRVSLAAEFEIADAEMAMNRVEDFQQALYLTLQLGLRELVGGAEIDDVLEKRDEFGQRLTERSAPEVEEYGMRLRSVDIKDIMFPGDLKRMFARVVEARKEGQAALEKARGETAALRSLANAAKIVEANPALMHLRLLQELGRTSGNTVIIGVPGSTTPVPVRTDGEPPPALEEPSPPNS